MTSINIAKELDRIGGEAELLAYSDNGVIKDAYFVSRAPVRGFEKLVLGKNPVFVINAVMRICGICHAAHGIASSEAFEDAMGIAPPYNGRLLREAIGLANRVQSHILHLTLMLPDMVSRDKLVNYSVRVIKLFNEINDILAILGGAPTHPPYIVIGGVLKKPDEKTINNLIEKLRRFLEEYRVLRKELYSEAENSVRVEELKNKKYKPKPIATHLYYGDRYNIDPSKVKILRYTEYRENNIPSEARNNTSMVAKYSDEFVETGPRARLAIYRGFTGESLWDIQVARFTEIEIDVIRIIELLEKIEHGEPSMTKILTYRAGSGIGVYEAPRGTLIHWVKLDDNGRVRYYKIVVPTMFNIPHMEKAAIGFKEEYVDAVPRIYDPCIPCATHVIRINSPGGER